jgi:hypothetical protein
MTNRLIPDTAESAQPVEHTGSPHSPEEYITSPQSPTGLFGVRIPTRCGVRRVRTPSLESASQYIAKSTSQNIVKPARQVRSFITHFNSAPASTQEVIAINILL